MLVVCCCCCVASVVSDSVQPHRRQPTRLPRPWDSPGKNTGVGCHFLLQCIKVKSESEVTQSCLTPSNPRDCSPPSSSVHGILQARVLEWGAIAFSMRLSSFLFILFSSCCSVSAVFAILSSSSLLCSAASLILLLVPPNGFSPQLLCSLLIVRSLNLLGPW